MKKHVKMYIGSLLISSFLLASCTNNELSENELQNKLITKIETQEFSNALSYLYMEDLYNKDLSDIYKSNEYKKLQLLNVELNVFISEVLNNSKKDINKKSLDKEKLHKEFKLKITNLNVSDKNKELAYLSELINNKIDLIFQMDFESASNYPDIKHDLDKIENQIKQYYNSINRSALLEIDSLESYQYEWERKLLSDVREYHLGSSSVAVILTSLYNKQPKTSISEQLEYLKVYNDALKKLTFTNTDVRKMVTDLIIKNDKAIGYIEDFIAIYDDSTKVNERTRIAKELEDLFQGKDT